MKKSKPVDPVGGEAEEIGFVHMLADLGVFAKQALKIRVDATAGIAIASRLGAGRIRHIHTPALWPQQEVIDSRVSMDKVHGPENPADAGTKHLTGHGLERHMKRMGFYSLAG